MTIRALLPGLLPCMLLAGQRSFIPFAPLSVSSLEGGPAVVTAGPPSGRTIAVLDAEAPRLRFYALDSAGVLAPAGTRVLHEPARAACVAHLPGHAGPEIAVLGREGNTVCIVSTGSALRCVTFDGKGEGIHAADIDSDKKPDLLVFGRSMSGVQVLRPDPGGGLAAGPVLFPDHSVSDLATADLNGDRITDVVLLSWLREELLILYGIGRGVFSQELVVPLAEEPRQLVLIPPGRRRSFGVVVTHPRSRRLTVYEGSTAGIFEARESIPVHGEVRSLHLADVTGNGLRDLVIGTSLTLSLAEGIAPFAFDTPVPLGLGSSLVGAVPADLNGDGFIDLVTADRTSRQLFALPNTRGRLAQPLRMYAVGGSPCGVAVHDVTGDDLPDILVANRGTDNITVLRNGPDGVFRSQRSIPTPPRPEYVRVAESRQAGPLVISHPSTDILSIIRPGGEGPDSTVTISTGSSPRVLRARVGRESGMLDALVRYSSPREGSVALSLFEEIGGQRFIERSVRPSVPGRIVALTAGDLTRNGMYDVVFAVRGGAPGTYTLSAALSGASFDLRTVREVISLSDTTLTGVSLFAGRVDEDPFPDLLIVARGPRPRLAVSAGRGDGSFADSLTWIGDVDLMEDAGVQLADADGDGRTDILYLDPGHRAIGVLYQRPAGSFRPPVYVVPAPDARSFGVARIGERAQPALIVPHAARGTVSIHTDAFRP